MFCFAISHRHPPAPMGAGAGSSAFSGNLKRGVFNSTLYRGHQACRWTSPSLDGDPSCSILGGLQIGLSGSFHKRLPAGLSFPRLEAEAKETAQSMVDGREVGQQRGTGTLMSVSVRALVAQLCPTLCDPVNCNLSGYFVHGILQARILK